MQKVFLILFVGIMGFWVSQRIQESPMINDVLIENVEALASFENSIPVVCQGLGEAFCPNDGKKYAYIYEGYSLR